MDRQREDGIGEVIGDGTKVFFRVKIAEGGLPMHRDGVIDGRWDILSLQCFLKLGSDFFVSHLYDILCPAGVESSGDLRGLDHALQLLGVAFSHSVDRDQFVVAEGFQFDEEDGRLDAVESGVEADTDVVVTVAPLAMQVV